jgi:hypothetical protein
MTTIICWSVASLLCLFFSSLQDTLHGGKCSTMSNALLIMSGSCGAMVVDAVAACFH